MDMPCKLMSAQQGTVWPGTVLTADRGLGHTAGKDPSWLYSQAVQHHTHPDGVAKL